MDNKQIKDGVGNLFNIRMRDLSSAGDGSLLRSMVLASSYPIDYGNGGMFQHCAKSGAIAAGMAAAAPIYAFQFPGALQALIKRIRLTAWVGATAFVAGLATFDLFAARGFTAQYTGGTTANLSGDAAQLRSSMGASLASVVYSNAAALTVGTRVLDPDPLESRTVAAPTTANTPITPTALTLFEKQQGEHPLLLVANEGFVVRATVPATGIWSFAITTEWDEVATF